MEILTTRTNFTYITVTKLFNIRHVPRFRVIKMPQGTQG